MADVESVCSVMRMAYVQGHSWTGGNVSRRIDGKTFLITPAGASAERMGILTPADLVKVSLENDRLPVGKASSESQVHAALYRRLRWCNAVVHAHPVYTLALDSDPRIWPRESASSRWFAGAVAATQASISGQDLAVQVSDLLSRLGDSPPGRYGFALFVPNHGLFAAATTPERALYFLNKIEENARLAYLRRVHATDLQ